MLVSDPSAARRQSAVADDVDDGVDWHLPEDTAMNIGPEIEHQNIPAPEPLQIPDAEPSREEPAIATPEPESDPVPAR
jgi:hypothetical protein